MGDRAIAIASDINCCVPATPQQFLVTQADHTAAPKALASTRTYFRRATILACKALDGTNNTGDVQLGPSASASEQPFLLAPGDQVSLEAPTGAKWDFEDWYFTVASDGDGLVVIYS